MMEFHHLYDEALTLEQHRALTECLGRPLTDLAIGGSDGAKTRRSRDASASAVFTSDEIQFTGRYDNDEFGVWVRERERAKRRWIAKRAAQDNT